MDPDITVVARRGRHAIARSALFADALRLAESLPDRRYAANYCTDRYNFLTALLAAGLRGQITCLPNDRTPATLASIADRYPGLYAAADSSMPTDAVDVHTVDVAGDETVPKPGLPEIPDDQVAVHVFTSGTTGRPLAHEKTWGALRVGTGRLARRVGFDLGEPVTIVATVPSQHMYGLETSIMMPFVAGWAAYSGHPFYPADIGQALDAVPEPRLLVTTPVHLRALVMDGGKLPKTAMIISATADLSAELAARAEALFATEVVEIFGFTEAGSTATRRTVAGDVWRLLDGYALEAQDGVMRLSGPHLREPVEMSDLVAPRSATEFVLRGRTGDMIIVAGKRTSLAGLNAVLSEIDGIEDGTFYAPAETETGRAARLIAVVVAPQRTAADIAEQLRQRLDAAFVPRRIFHVPELPRNEVGKLTSGALSELVKRLTREKA